MVMWSAAVWLVLFGLYLLLAGSVDRVEMVCGLICASLGTALASGLVRVAHRRFRLRPPLRAIVDPILALVPEAFTVGVELVRVAIYGARGQRGVFVRQPFEPGGDDAMSAGRRAVAVIGVSLAPRSFVIRGDRADTMMVHAMPPKQASTDARWPA